MISKKVFRGEYRWATLILSALLLVLIGCAVYAGAYYHAMQNRCCDCTRVMDMAPVVKVTQPLRAGQRLHPAMVTVEDVPERFLPPDPLLGGDLSRYEGRTLRVDVPAGQMLLEADFDVPERENQRAE